MEARIVESNDQEARRLRSEHASRLLHTAAAAIHLAMRRFAGRAARPGRKPCHS